MKKMKIKKYSHKIGKTFSLIALFPIIYGNCLATTVPDARYDKLSRGVNLSGAFSDSWWSPVNEEWFKNTDHFIRDSDFKVIKDIGCKHVRLPITPSYVSTLDGQGSLIDKNVDFLEKKIQQIIDSGLAVIVDIHPDGKEKEFMDAFRDPNDQSKKQIFYNMWSNLASRLSKKFTTDSLFFEVLNEPGFNNNKELWWETQKKCVEAIRKAAPDYTMIVSPWGASGPEYFADWKPYEDSNLVYTAHFYEPQAFTHQGASWGGLGDLKGVPYPYNPRNRKFNKILNSLPKGSEPYNALDWYITEGFDKSVMNKKFQDLSDWAKKYQARIYVGEFGVLNLVSPRADALQWYRDLMDVLNTYHFARCKWDYRGFDGIIKEELSTGKRTVDQELVKALGL